MPRLPQVSGKDVIRALKKIDFKVVHQRGSHVKLSRTVGSQRQIVIVPLQRVIKKGTLRNGILRPLNLSVGEFAKLLKR